MIILGGSPHMVAAPPQLAAKISAMITGIGLNFSIRASSIVIELSEEGCVGRKPAWGCDWFLFPTNPSHLGEDLVVPLHSGVCPVVPLPVDGYFDVKMDVAAHYCLPFF